MPVIASHQHRFIFLKTRKTAGTSVEIALSKVCGPDDVITEISPEDEARGVDLSEHSESAYSFGEESASYEPLAEDARA